MVDIRLPDIAENVDSGDVVKVLVNVGDTVKKDQPLIELETDKAVFEVPATTDGVVAEILVQVGDTVKVGGIIARIDPTARSAEGVAGGETKAAEAEETAEAEVSSARNERGSSEVPAEVVDAQGAPAVEKVEVEDTPEPAPVAEAADAPQHADVVPLPRTGPAPASPTVRRLAREIGVDIHQVAGAGPGGRISADDVHRFAKGIIQGSTRSQAAPAPGKALPDFSRFGEVERVAMSKIRQVTAANMAYAWNTVPAVTQNDEADITELEAARKKYAKLAEDAGGKLTMTAILLKLCAGALERFPDLNASVDVAANEIVYKKYVHMGVAVDTEYGLLVPVVRDVDTKNIIELSVELADMATRARNRKLTPAEMEGANFTISNLGGIGGTSFSPIVNTPESAILGVSRAKMQPVWKGDGFEPRLVMPLSLSYDHRFVDGALAARFVRWLAEALENPILLALDA
jgi:pyruvate dehydrogenase E2 component (dihydrolipoamide acetyltransferase)